MVGIHYFDLVIICGIGLVLVAGVSFLVYFLVTANSRQRNEHD